LSHFQAIEYTVHLIRFLAVTACLYQMKCWIIITIVPCTFLFQLNHALVVPQQTTRKRTFFGSSNLFDTTNGAIETKTDEEIRKGSRQERINHANNKRPVKNQAEYGKALELPGTYVRCGSCKAHFALAPDDLGVKGKGRRLECSLCGNRWFQSKDRVNALRDGMELVPFPQSDMDRIELNKKEGKDPGFLGDVKLYVGNVAFECTEEQLYKEFSNVGSVGDVALAFDNATGRPKGFAFIVMRTKEDAENACKLLNEADVAGRNIKVHYANY